MSEPLHNRFDFVYFFEVSNGNPNGDPDAGNLPRVDPETNHGIVTDVCIKRKIRNYVEDAAVHFAAPRASAPQYNIYVREGAVLNQEHEKAYSSLNLAYESKKLPIDPTDARRVNKWMCHNFFDIRTFGAVMTTEINCGQVRGPIQLTFAVSIDPVTILDIAMTRASVTNERDIRKRSTIGRKYVIPYALFRCFGFVSPGLAAKTCFSVADLDILKAALNNMFDNDRSAGRGIMAPVRCIAFKHDKPTGNARADELFRLVTAEALPARSGVVRTRHDYRIDVSSDMPAGITLEEWVK